MSVWAVEKTDTKVAVIVESRLQNLLLFIVLWDFVVSEEFPFQYFVG